MGSGESARLPPMWLVYVSLLDILQVFGVLSNRLLPPNKDVDDAGDVARFLFVPGTICGLSWLVTLHG